MTSSDINSTKSSDFWSNRGYRKRKIDINDFGEKPQHKIFLTEEMLIKNMQSLSLDLSEHGNSFKSQNFQDNDDENLNEDEKNNSYKSETQFELHDLLKDTLRKDDLRDSLMNTLYYLERRKLSMQIVPYMPLYPTQLNNNNNNNSASMDEVKQKEEDQNPKTPPVKLKENDDHLFRRPLPPTPYTVEEPFDNTSKRTPKMKRSYSQSVRYNSNLSVVEIKDDINDYSTYPSQSNYIVVEPSTPVTTDPITSCAIPTLRTNQPSVQISECFDFPSPSEEIKNTFKSLDDSDVNMELIALTDENEKMDDDI